MDWTFGPLLVLDPATDQGLAGATVQLYAPADTSRSTPLQAYDLADVPVVPVSGPKGVLPQFRAQIARVIAKSGAWEMQVDAHEVIVTGTVPGGASSLTPVAVTTTTPAGSGVGDLVGYYATAACTVDGVALAAGESVVLVWDGAAWVLPTLVGGGTPADTTKPTAGTLSVTVSTTTATGSVAGALDETALHASPYRFGFALSSASSAWTDDQWRASATWSAYQASASYSGWAGLSPSTSYGFRAEVRDEAGNWRLTAVQTRTTSAAAGYTTLSAQSYAGVTDGTLLSAVSTTGTVPTLSGGGAATAQVQSGVSTAPVASGYQPAYTATVVPGVDYRRVRVTYAYDTTAATFMGGGRFGVKVCGNAGGNWWTEAYVGPRDGTFDLTAYGGTKTTVTEPSPPAIGRSGTIVIEAVWDGTSTAAVWTLKVNGVLHTTWTTTLALRTSGTLGISWTVDGSMTTAANRAGLTSYTMEVSAT